MLRLRVFVSAAYASHIWYLYVGLTLLSNPSVHFLMQSYIEQLGAQIIGALIMIGVGLVGSIIIYSALYVIPISPFIRLFDKYVSQTSFNSDTTIWILYRIFFLSPKGADGKKQHKLIYKGGWLLTHPDEDFARMAMNDEAMNDDENLDTPLLQPASQQVCNYGIVLLHLQALAC